jgi:uncharacterized damage-inducible protein DinB
VIFVVLTMVKVRELLEYNQNVRHEYFKKLARIPWREFTKNREASFNSIRNIFIHALNAMDYWLDFVQNEDLHSKRKFDEYKTFDEVRAYMEHVENRMVSYLDSLPAKDLKRKHKVTCDGGEAIEVTAEDILIHVFEEEVHHRGELIALLWQMNIEPPPMGWKGL